MIDDAAVPAAMVDADEQQGQQDQQRLADLMERLQEQSDEARLLEESIGRVDQIIARGNARLRTRGGDGEGPPIDEDLGVTNDIIEDDEPRPRRQQRALRRRREERRRGARNALRVYLVLSISLAILAVVASPADELFSSIKGSLDATRKAQAAQISQAVENIARTTHNEDERRIIADLLSGYPGLVGLNNLVTGGDNNGRDDRWERVASAFRAAGQSDPGSGTDDLMPGSKLFGHLIRGMTRRYEIVHLLLTNWLQWSGNYTSSVAESTNETRAQADQSGIQSGRWQLPWNRRSSDANATQVNSTREHDAARRTEATVDRVKISTLLWEHFHPSADAANATALVPNQCKSDDSGILGPFGGKGRGWDEESVSDKPEGSDLVRSTVIKVLSSAPRVLAVANLIVAFTFVIHNRLANLFLGPVESDGRYPLMVREALRRRGSGRQKISAFLFFKLLVMQEILEPDSADFLCLLLWFASLALMRSLVHLAGRESSHSSQAGEVPTRGVVALLSSVGVCAATFAVAAASVLGASSNWSLLAVLATDCVLNLIKCVPPLIRYGAAAAEAEHRRAVAVLEERQASPHPGADEEEFGQVEREIEARESAIASRLTSLETVVFATELIDLALSSGHFLHLWSIHGTHFGIVDGVIALHFHSSVTAIGRKISERRNIHHVARELDKNFEDATELEVRKASAAGDVCCICLGGLGSGRVKRLRCGHLFHSGCLREVCERESSIRAAKCPLCRSSLDPSSDAVTSQANHQVAMAPLEPPQPVPQQAAAAPPEQSLLRFSTEDFLPSWLPVPAFAFEVVRRDAVAMPTAGNQTDGGGGTWQSFFRRGGQVPEQEPPPPPDDAPAPPQEEGAEQPQQELSLWRRLLVLAGFVPMTPEEEAVALDQLVDMFPQYERADLLRELRVRRSAEAVAESILLGFFSGRARGE